MLLSIMGITLEEIEVNASLPINPTIIRIMRVLRIARGRSSTRACLPLVIGLHREMENQMVMGMALGFQGLSPSLCIKGLPSMSGLGYG